MNIQSETPAGEGAAEAQVDRSSDNISLADFSDVIVGMSRLLYELARIPPFRDSSLGLAEWVALFVLQGHGPMTHQQLGRALGLGPRRADELRLSLGEAGYISVDQSKENARKKIIAITEPGKVQLRTLNLILEPLLKDALKDRERTLASAKQSTRIMMRLVQKTLPSEK